jgi:hypothetical protein
MVYSVALNEHVGDQLELNALADVHSPWISKTQIVRAGPLALITTRASGLIGMLIAIVIRISPGDSLTVRRRVSTRELHSWPLNMQVLHGDATGVLDLQARPSVD